MHPSSSVAGPHTQMSARRPLHRFSVTVMTPGGYMNTTSWGTSAIEVLISHQERYGPEVRIQVAPLR